MKKLNFRHTVTACCLGSVTLAASNNLPPLLFLIFSESFQIPLSTITVLITVNFVIQLTVDFLAALFADRVGYRPLLMASALFAALGLVGFGTLPFLFENAMVGLLIADVLCALGGGLGEALVSPTVEACPTKNKSAMMGFLHSFYCWGTVAVILVSTPLLLAVGRDGWWLLPVIWSLLPFINTILFAVVPLPDMTGEAATDGAPAMGARRLLARPLFWCFLVLMMLAGASELSASQWASTFAEAGLGVSKAVGDLAGPCLFACLMGLSRVFYAKMSERINLRLFILLSAALSFGAYLLTALPASPVLAFAGLALNGLAVGMLWPGLLSLAAARFPNGGTPLFSICALFGDLGCSVGPTIVGLVAATAAGVDFTNALLLASLFPLLLFVILLAIGEGKKSTPKE